MLKNVPYTIIINYLNIRRHDYGVQQSDVLKVQVLQECAKFLLKVPKFDIKTLSVEQLDKFMKKHKPYTVMAYIDDCYSSKNGWTNITPNASELHKLIHSNSKLNIKYNKNLDNNTHLISGIDVKHDTGLMNYDNYQFRLLTLYPPVCIAPDYFEEILVYIDYIKVLRISYIVRINTLNKEDNDDNNSNNYYKKEEIEIDEYVQKKYIDKTIMEKMLRHCWYSEALECENVRNIILERINKYGLDKCDFNGIEDGDYVL
jgi:hypothetical protein